MGRGKYSLEKEIISSVSLINAKSKRNTKKLTLSENFKTFIKSSNGTAIRLHKYFQ